MSLMSLNRSRSIAINAILVLRPWPAAGKRCSKQIEEGLVRFHSPQASAVALRQRLDASGTRRDGKTMLSNTLRHTRRPPT